MSITHAAIAAAGTSLVLGTANPLHLGLAIIGSQLPDLDTTTSTIGQIFFPISSWIEDRFPHRSITHSLVATGVIAIGSILVCYLLNLGVTTAIALPLGHLLSSFSDCFTKQGVQLFWPNPAWAISVSNPNRRLKTGGTSELYVLAAAIALLIAGIYFATDGGITSKVTQTLGLRDDQLKAYNQSAGTNHVYAEIEGVKAGDRSSINGRYFILDTAAQEFVLLDNQGNLYQTNQQIIVDKLATEVGSSATTQIETLTFNDEEPIPKLLQLQKQYLNSAVFISGSLAVDFPEEVKVTVSGDSLPTVAVSGSSVQLNYASVEEAIAALKDQYGIGTLQVKIIEPKPFYD